MDQRASRVSTALVGLALLGMGASAFHGLHPRPSVCQRRCESRSCRETLLLLAGGHADDEASDEVLEPGAMDTLRSRIEDLQLGRSTLPVVVMDAILPGQQLEMWTNDETFCAFLDSQGKGSNFGMVGLDPQSRRVMRRGVEVQVTGMEYERDGIRARFSGDRLFRMLGAGQESVGRWRRAKSSDGQPQSAFGWGPETFLQEEIDQPGTPLPMALPHIPGHSSASVTAAAAAAASAVASANSAAAAASVASSTEEGANARVEWLDPEPEQTPSEHAQLLWSAMRPQVDQWLDLVQSRGHERMPNHLSMVLESLGPCPTPDRPGTLALWLAALINPIPPLGVAPEVRPRVLLSGSADERLAVVYAGLARSIAILEGRERDIA